MEDKKSLISKLFDAPFYVHFICWFFVTAIMFFGLFALLGGYEAIAPFLTTRGAIGLPIICSFMALLFAGLNAMAKKSIKIFDAIALIRERAEQATTSETLNEIRQEMVNFGSKCVHEGHYRERHKIVSFIDTRLKYEFKV